MSRRLLGPVDWLKEPGLPPLSEKPVAITVTRISSCSVSSITAPKMITASGSAASAMISAASLTSKRPRLLLPVMLSRMPRALDGSFEQRAGDRLFCGFDGPVFAGGPSDPHQGRAGAGHDGANVREIEVDEAGHRDQVRNPLHTLPQDVVGDPKGLEHRRPLVHYLQQAIVGDDDQGIDLFPQLRDTPLSLGQPFPSFKRERFGDHRHGQRRKLLGDLGDHGRAAGAGGPPYLR